MSFYVTSLLLACIAFYTCQCTMYEAECIVDSTSGDPTYPVQGKVEIKQEGDMDASIKISLSGFVTGDAYDTHGFHIHENGDLGNGCKDAGGHYNPTKVNHAGPENPTRHVGDLGNIVEDPNGNVEITKTDNQVKLSGDTSVIGRSIVIHEKADDLGLGGTEGSLKTGSAGMRLGCCKIHSTTPGTSSAPAVTTSLLSVCLSVLAGLLFLNIRI